MKPFSVSAIAKPEHANSTLLAESPGYYANSSDRLKVFAVEIQTNKLSLHWIQWFQSNRLVIVPKFQNKLLKKVRGKLTLTAVSPVATPSAIVFTR